MTATTLTMLKIRREEVRKIVYAVKNRESFDDEEMRSMMRNIRHMTSLHTINLDFSWQIYLIRHIF